ncbi:MAG: response regulator transcription factor [Pseudobdellovibrio sp.]|nr:response regulator transcription factor [Pseudobdellovibrio sp.]
MFVQIVEDDPILARALQVNLELEGHRVVLNNTLESAKKQLQESSLDFVILDLGLPDGSGFSYLEKIKNEFSHIPVIILSAQSDEDSVVKGLTMGANDFVKKPYSYKELAARMQVVLKKPTAKTNVVEFGGVKVFEQDRLVKYNDVVIDFNRREFDIFFYMMKNAERIISRDSLLQFLDKESEIFDRTIDSHISHLRKNLKKHAVDSIKISSVYGLGYRLEKND